MYAYSHIYSTLRTSIINLLANYQFAYKAPPRDRWGSTSPPWVRKYTGFVALIGTGLSRS